MRLDDELLKLDCQDDELPRAEDFQQLFELSCLLSTNVVLSAALSNVIKTMAAIMQARKGMVMLWDEETGHLTHAASIGFDDEFIRLVERVPAGVGGCGKAVTERREVIVQDVYTDPIFEPLRDAARQGGFRASYSFPLFAKQGSILGTLAVLFERPYRPTTRQRRMVQLIATQAAQVIHNARLYADAQEIQQQLREKAQYVETLFQAAPDPICVCDPAGYVREANEAFVDCLAQPVLDRPLDELLRLPPQQDMSALVLQTTQQGTVRNVRVEMSRSAEPSAYLLSLSAIRRPPNRIGGFICVLRNIQEQEALLRQLELSRQELYEKVRDLETLHDVFVERELKMAALQQELQQLRPHGR